MILNNLILTKEEKEDFLHCKRIMEKNSKTFSMAFGKLPSPKKEAVWAYYAFNRLIDDIGDEEKDISKLQQEELKIKQLFLSNPPDEPVYRALARVHQIFPLDEKAIRAMFLGQYRDAKSLPILTEDELYEYCYQVAGSVGHMLLPIVATTNKKQLWESARDIGIGMQLTNILRDAREDYLQNRIYMPLAMLQTDSIDLEKEIKEGPSENYIRLWEYFAKQADFYYKKGMADISLYDKDCQWILKAAVMLYRSIIGAARSEKYGLGKRAYLTKVQKLKLLAELKHSPFD
jgi:phytoene/squalene synthetase